MNFKNKTVSVVGLAKSGFAAAKFLHRSGAKVRVTEFSDKKEALESAEFLRNLGIQVETGGHTETFIKGSALVVTSPGVPKKSLPLVTAKKFKIPVISEVELASFFCKGQKIGVTGSNGKTTASNLIARAIQNAGKKSVLCGNVGYSFLEAIHEIDHATTAVVELSSFQLEDSPTFHPKIAVMLNISPNHLDRHGTMESYIQAKSMIFRNQKKSDLLILNNDDAVVRGMAKKANARVIFFSKNEIPNGFFVRGKKIIVKYNGRERTVLDCSRFKLKGDHNLENILAAAAVAWALRLPWANVQKTFNSFDTLEHRIEPIGLIDGISFINDSKSTTIESTKAAIDATPCPVVLIAGGRDKGANFSDLEPLLIERVKHVVLYGEAREKIASSWKNYDQFELEHDFRNAVKKAFDVSKRGDSILLSPMCTSFDQFSCFEERGEVFKELFNELALKKATPAKQRLMKSPAQTHSKVSL